MKDTIANSLKTFESRYFSGQARARHPLLAGPYPPIGAWVFLAMTMMFCWAMMAWVIWRNGSLRVSDISNIGGDFLVYWSAAKASYAGDAVLLYNADWLNDHLVSLRPYDGNYGYYWQYPPTFLMVLAPFGLGSYGLGLALWIGATLAFLLFVLRQSFTLGPKMLILIALSPLAFLGLASGQNGFLIGALFILAVDSPKTRPIVAGVAAGVLTIKPHLGVLIPVAYIAAGCWRAFGVAAITAVGLAALSVIFFGFEAWLAFFDGMGVASDRLVTSDMEAREGYPVERMLSPFAVLYSLGVSASVSMAAQGVSALVAVALTFWVWSSPRFAAYRAALLCCFALLVPPYVYHYDMAVLLYPCMVLIVLAQRGKVLSFESLAIWVFGLVTLFCLHLPSQIRVILLFALPVIFAALLMRRAFHRFGSEALPV